MNPLESFSVDTNGRIECASQVASTRSAPGWTVLNLINNERAKWGQPPVEIGMRLVDSCGGESKES